MNPLILKPLTWRQRAYCVNRASGLSRGKAYIQASYSAKTLNQADKNAYILERKPHVFNYLQKLRKESSEGDVLTIQEIRLFLAKVVRTPIDNLK